MANKIIFGADLIDVLENKCNMNKLGEVPTKYKNGVITVDFIYGKEKNIDDLKYDKPYVEFSIDDETDGFISGTMYLNGGVEGVQFDSWEDLKYFMKNAKWTESSLKESNQMTANIWEWQRLLNGVCNFTKWITRTFVKGETLHKLLEKIYRDEEITLDEFVNACIDYIGDYQFEEKINEYVKQYLSTDDKIKNAFKISGIKVVESKKSAKRSLKESAKKHLVKGLDVDFVVDHLLSLEDSDNFDLINKLGDLWEVYNKSWNKFSKSLSDFWKVMNDIEELDSFDKTCKKIIEAWYDDIEDIFYSDDDFENLKLNYGFKGNDIFESKKSLKEEIDRPTWSKWVVNNVHHIGYFFNGKIVDKKMLNSLFESEGFDTNVDAVEDEIKKTVRSVRLGNLDGNALHIAHNSVGNRIDLVFDIGQLMGEVESLSDGECIIRINGDIYEQGEDMWNFGFAIYLTCDTHPLDFALAESKKKSTRKSQFFC